MSSSVRNAQQSSAVSPPWSSDLVTAGAAVICAMVTWGSTKVADVELAVERGGEVQQISGGAVALTAAAAALVGLAALRALERLTHRALVVWTVLAVVATAVSFVGPVGATSAAARGALISLHAVVAAVVIASAYASRRRLVARNPTE
jgi:hypothetical protein